MAVGRKSTRGEGSVRLWRSAILEGGGGRSQSRSTLLPVSPPESPTLRSLRAIGAQALLSALGQLVRFQFGFGNSLGNGSSQPGFFALLLRQIRTNRSGFLFLRISRVGESGKRVHRHTEGRDLRGSVRGGGRRGRGNTRNRRRSHWGREWNGWRDRRSLRQIGRAACREREAVR